MVKGYEFSKDQYVTFTEEELKAMEQESNKAIDITEFVPASEVDPIYFDKPYYLWPREGRREGLPSSQRGDEADGPSGPGEVGRPRKSNTS